MPRRVSRLTALVDLSAPQRHRPIHSQVCCHLVIVFRFIYRSCIQSSLEWSVLSLDLILCSLEIIPSVFSHCWLSIGKGIQPVISIVVTVSRTLLWWTNLVDVEVILSHFRPTRINGVVLKIHTVVQLFMLQPCCQFLDCITISHCSVCTYSNL